MGARDDHRPSLVLIDLWGWTFDTWWQDVGPDEDTDEHHASEHVGVMRRQILALFRFMAEEIVYSGRERIPRPGLRRWGRSKKKVPEDGSIVTIHLRRIKQSKTRFEKAEGDETEQVKIVWSHRWWVIGHHRFNPKTGQKDIWVRPYLKPKDPTLPIIIKEKLIAVDR